jgi:hypothetical protein
VQLVQVELPSLLAKFTLSVQVKHTLEVEAPVCSEYEPAGHFVHESIAPVIAMYVPSGQSEHCAGLLLLYLPNSHGIHVFSEDAPITAEYFPARQLMH